MINIYFDDSSDPLMAEFVACGGIVGEEFRIAALESRWREITRVLKQPFRSTECECQKGQFSAWSKESCNQLMARLVGVITDDVFSVGSYGTVIPVPLFRSIFASKEREAPYLLAVGISIVEMARLGEKYNEPVRLIFEKGDYNGRIERLYWTLKDCGRWGRNVGRRLTGISFAEKALVPLQPADLVARETFKWAMNLGKRPLRKPIKRLWDRVGVALWGDDTLKAIREGGWPENPCAITALPEEYYMQVREMHPSKLVLKKW